MSPRFIPDRGDIVWLDHEPQAGHQQSGRRPSLVLSLASYNSRTGLFLCCPIPSQQKGYPFEVPLPSGGKVGGVVLADQLKSLDWRARRATRVSKTTDLVVMETLARARVLLAD